MIVSFTPIHSGSKGIADKNIRLLNGKPLFHHVVLEAQKVSALDEVWISTASKYYASLAPSGVQVHEYSKESASDTSSTTDVVMKFVKYHPNVSTIVILQATSPTTTSGHIEEALRCSASGKGCVSVKPVPVHLYRNNEPLWTERKRMDDTDTFAEDGSIYVIHVADFLRTKCIPTLPCNTMVIQHPVCDIDTEQDIERASKLLSRTFDAVIDIDESFLRLKSGSRKEQWSIQALGRSKYQLQEFILHLIKQIPEQDIRVNVDGIIIEEGNRYVVSNGSQLKSFWRDIIIPKCVDGKTVQMQNTGDNAVMELVRQNNLQRQNILILIFGTEIVTGLYINGNVVQNAEIGRSLPSGYLTNFETSDALQLVKELSKIKKMLSLDDIYVSGFISKHKNYTDVLECYGIKTVDSHSVKADVMQISSKEQEHKNDDQCGKSIEEYLIHEDVDTSEDESKLQIPDTGPDGSCTTNDLYKTCVSTKRVVECNGKGKMDNSNKGLVFVTCTRADFSKMTPLISEALTTDLPVTIWVSGMHLQEEFGSTYMEVVKTFSSTRAEIVFRSNHAKSMSQTFINTADAFNRWLQTSIDTVFVHGDRIESLACATIAVLRNTKVCHIEGGELSGTIDESLRHAITKLSHIHLVSNESSRLRLIQMGENETHVHDVGSPEVATWLNSSVEFSEVKHRYDIDYEERDYIVLLYHPITINFNPEEIRHVVDCCIASELNFVVIKCNNDMNYETIVKEYKRFEHNPHFKQLPSMRFECFVSLIKHSNGLIGNSSVGVRETPVIGIPSINIGCRQRNRSTEAQSIIHVPDYRDLSVTMLKEMKTIPRAQPVWEFGSSECVHHFGKLLRSFDLSGMDIQKYFVDI